METQTETQHQPLSQVIRIKLVIQIEDEEAYWSHNGEIRPEAGKINCCCFRIQILCSVGVPRTPWDNTLQLSPKHILKVFI